MRRMLFVGSLGLLLITLDCPPTEAHAQLIGASPSVGSTVSSSPAEVRLRFSEGVEPRFSGASVTDASGAQVGGRSSVDPGNPGQIVIRLSRRLPPGTYRVNWHVISVDTHQTQGAFTFEVRP